MDNEANTNAALRFYQEHHFRNHQNCLRTSITFATDSQKRTFAADVHLEVSGYNRRLIIQLPPDVPAEEVPMVYELGFDTWRFDGISKSLSIIGKHSTHGRYETTFHIAHSP